MVQPTNESQDLPFCSPVGRLTRLPIRRAADLVTEPPARPIARTVTGRPVRVRKHAIREVVVVEVAGRLGQGVEELDRAIQLALAEGPRGVVCDLSGVMEDTAAKAVEVLAAAGRHVRDWPGIPMAVVCPDPQVREGLEAHPLRGHLIVEASLFSAVTAVLATPTVNVEWLQLAPHPTAPRASREFVTRTLLDWRLGRTIPFATLVVSELVASSSVNAGTDIDLSVAWNLGALRLTVRDRGAGLLCEEGTVPYLHGRGLTVVAGLSRAFGVLPTADGGKVVWAVLEAPRQRATNRGIRSGREDPAHEPPVLTDGRGQAALPSSTGPAPAPPRKTAAPSAAPLLKISRRPAE